METDGVLHKLNNCASLSYILNNTPSALQSPS